MSTITTDEVLRRRHTWTAEDRRTFLAEVERLGFTEFYVTQQDIIGVGSDGQHVAWFGGGSIGYREGWQPASAVPHPKGRAGGAADFILPLSGARGFSERDSSARDQPREMCPECNYEKASNGTCMC